LFFFFCYYTFVYCTVWNNLNACARERTGKEEGADERVKWSKGGDVARWLEMVGERGRGGSTAQGLRAEFIPLDKVAPHPPPPGHVGLIPWDKLAEPACLRITSPRYTLAYGRYSRTNLTVRGALFATCLGLAEIGNEPFCRRLFFRRLFFFFIHVYSPRSTRDKLAEWSNLRYLESEGQKIQQTRASIIFSGDLRFEISIKANVRQIAALVV